MTIFSEERVHALYSTSLASAIEKLKQLRVYSGNAPKFSGLHGWVFEQTVQYCIKKEVRARKLNVEILEQVKLIPRVNADLKIGKAFIEIKQSGLFSSADVAKYASYRKAANQLGLKYLFVSGGESYEPYRHGITVALGRTNTFFLDTSGDWERFINRLVSLR